MISFDSISTTDKRNDVEILNNAFYNKRQGIWASDFAVGELRDINVGKTVLALALENQADRQQHRNILSDAIRDWGVNPVQAESSYNPSSYLNIEEGTLDSDVNFAKLALEVDP